MMTTDEKLNFRRAMKSVSELYEPRTLFNPTDEQLIGWKMNQGIVSADMITKDKIFHKSWLKAAREQIKLVILS